MPLHGKTPEEQYTTAPRMPSDRPCTKQEMWDWVVHMYGGVFEKPKLMELAQSQWAWSYVRAVNFDGWRKHPDWVPGDPVIADAVPTGPFTPDRSSFPNVNQLWEIAQAALERTAA